MPTKKPTKNAKKEQSTKRTALCWRPFAQSLKGCSFASTQSSSSKANTSDSCGAKSEETCTDPWAREVSGVAPLAAQKERLVQPARPSFEQAEAVRHAVETRIRHMEREPPRPNFEDLLKQGKPCLLETGQDCVAGLRPGVDARLLARLRGGDFRVRGVLDLHGKSVSDALEALDRFLVDAFYADKRCVLVIHGRGLGRAPQVQAREPALCELVPQWLCETWLGGLVVAFVGAPIDLGGKGACLILLRSLKNL